MRTHSFPSSSSLSLSFDSLFSSEYFVGSFVGFVGTSFLSKITYIVIIPSSVKRCFAAHVFHSIPFLVKCSYSSIH